MAAHISGINNPDELEVAVLRGMSSLRKHRSDAGGALAAFAAGRRRAFRDGDPVPRSALWVDRVGKVWSQTRAWFYTPMWFLLEPALRSEDELLACMAPLPQAHLEVLLDSFCDSMEPHTWALGFLNRSAVFALSAEPGPWTLGSLACAMHRARLAADAATARLANVGLIWTLRTLKRRIPRDVSSLLDDVDELCTEIQCSGKWGRLQVAPITQWDLDRFEQGRTEALRDSAGMFSAQAGAPAWT